MVYRARRHGGLAIVALFRWCLGLKAILRLCRAPARAGTGPWQADQPLVSVLL